MEAGQLSNALVGITIASVVGGFVIKIVSSLNLGLWVKGFVTAFMAAIVINVVAIAIGYVLAAMGVPNPGGIVGFVARLIVAAVLLMIALDMTLSKRPSQAKLTVKESEEAESRAEQHAEITVFPLATPLLAGPGAMTSAIVLAAGTHGDPKLLVAVVLAILAVMLVTLIFLLLAQEIHYLIGLTARKVIVRVFGVLLAAIAVQSIFNGIAAAHIFR